MEDNCIYPGVSQYAGNHWLKWGMRRLYTADYIHAWIGFRLGGFPLIYHSTGFGVHVVGLNNFGDERIIKHCWQIPLDPERFQQFVLEAFTETGKGYGFRQLYGMALVKGLSKIGIHLKKLPFGANRESLHVCSETSGRILMKYTPLEWGEKDPDLYSPKDFYDSCCELVGLGAVTEINPEVLFASLQKMG